ncbi:MAG: glycogen/starch synthase, partial [Candidatus Omnitrophica bacterium]|nr:glycogen/starch synthase [Candidatus Omnitrophota bacterium]
MVLDLYPATMSKTNQPDRAPTEEELKIILNGFGDGLDALVERGIILNQNNIIFTDRILPDGTLITKTEDGRPDLSRAPPEVQGETRRGIALVVRENGQFKLYLHHNILKIPQKHLWIIFKSHELYHLLYPYLTEDEVQIITLKDLIQTNTVDEEIEFLRNNDLDLRPTHTWFKILTLPEHPYEINNKINTLSSSLCDLTWGFYVFEIPESQVGGIADVSHGLPEAIVRAKTNTGISHRIFRVTPYYQNMKSMVEQINLDELEKIITIYIPYRGEVLKVEVYKRVIDNNFIDYLLKSDVFTFPYQKHDAKDQEEALKEIVAYNVTAAMLTLSGETNPDVVFLADWQLGLFLAYLVEVLNQEETILRKVIIEKEGRAYQGKQFIESFVQKRWLDNVAPICWINNGAYRGQFQVKDKEDFTEKSGLVSQESFERSRWITPHNHSEVFMILLKLCAETTGVLGGRVVTVSSAYANEIMGENLSSGEQPDMLYGIFQRLRVKGILNGVMPQWQYVKTVEEKKKAKLILQEQLGWEQGEDKRIIFMISRLVTQKGISLIIEAKEEIKELLREFPNTQLFIGGPVEDLWEERLSDIKEELESEFPKRVKFEFGFVQAKRFLEAGDLFLFPSLYEPCGTLGKNALNMVITLARLTGGLLESAMPIENDSGNAVVFSDYNKGAFINALSFACNIMQDKERWERIQQSAPSTVKTWDDQFLHYQEIIKEIRQTKNVEEKSSSSTSAEKSISDIQSALNQGSSPISHYRQAVSYESQIQSEEEFGKNWTSKGFTIQDLKDKKIPQGLLEENAQILLERLTELLEAITKTGPPEITNRFKEILPQIKFSLTNDPEKLGTDSETTLPYIASCDIQNKEVYLHVIDFFKQPQTKQLQILYHEIISHIVKGIIDEKEAIKDTVGFMMVCFYPVLDKERLLTNYRLWRYFRNWCGVIIFTLLYFLIESKSLSVEIKNLLLVAKAHSINLLSSLSRTISIFSEGVIKEAFSLIRSAIFCIFSLLIISL